MRNKVRKSLAFLLALALVVSVMSGLGLSVSAEQESNTPGTEEVQQQDKTEAGAAPSEVKAEEEAAKSEEKPVQEEKADEQKTEAEVYLVYKADGTGGGGTGGEIVQEQELTRRKWVEYNEADDTYDLSLSVSGAKGTQTNPAKLDIVLVLDVSSSMNNKIEAVKTAANSFISTVGENEAI